MQSQAVAPEAKEAGEVPYCIDALFGIHEKAKVQAESELDKRLTSWSTTIKGLIDNVPGNMLAWQRHTELLKEIEALEKDILEQKAEYFVNARALEAYEALESSKQESDPAQMSRSYLESQEKYLKQRRETLKVELKARKVDNSELKTKLNDIMMMHSSLGVKF